MTTVSDRKQTDKNKFCDSLVTFIIFYSQFHTFLYILSIVLVYYNKKVISNKSTAFLRINKKNICFYLLFYMEFINYLCFKN